MVLITGATGQLGTAVIEQLLRKITASEIAGLTRTEEKAANLKSRGVTIRLGDYNDTDSLDRAMQGVDKVLLIAGGSDPNGLEQHQNVVDAAKKAGVGCIAYTGRALADRHTLANRLMVRHFDTEDYIKASGLRYVLFRNILYMDVLPLYLGQNLLQEETSTAGILLPAGRGRVSFALRSDMGEAIANVLAETKCGNEVYHFTGTQAYSFDDVAAALTDLSGKTVTYTPVDEAAYAARLKQQGMSDFVVQLLTAFMTDIKNGQEEQVSTDLTTMLGREPAGLREGLKAFYGL